METLWQDVRYGLRLLRKSPAFTALAVVTLALGIGANTAMFSVVNAVLLEPLPFHEPGRLVQLWETESAPGNYPLTGADYLDWQKQNRTLAATCLVSWPENENLSAAGRAETATVESTQANFFSLLGVQPVLGRGFAKGEDAAGKNKVAVLSYGFWQSHFAGQSSAVGKAVRLNNESYTVIGVMPPSFNYPAGTELWNPLNMSPKNLGERGNHQWQAIARLAPGVTAPQARADLSAIEARLGKLYPNNDAGVKAVVIPLQEQLTRQSRGELWILLGAVGFVLLVACANLANLLLARASGRGREMAVRGALGADRLRLIRQVLTEAVTLALAGAALGLAAAWAMLRGLEGVKSLPIPRVHPLAIDFRVLLFTAGISFVVGILFGLAPALQASLTHLADALKSTGQAVVSSSAGRRRLRDALAVAEIALSLALLVGAGLFLRTFANMRNAGVGIRSEGLLTLGLTLPQTRYATPAARNAFFEALLEKTRRTPGVESAALSSEIPLEGGTNGYVQVPGNNNPALQNQLVEWNFISLDYFRVYGVPLFEGRNFTPEDLQQAGARMAKLLALYEASHGNLQTVPPDLIIPAIISRGMARAFWPHQDPLGKVFEGGAGEERVIGVVGDVKEWGLTKRAVPVAYFPMTAGTVWGVAGHLTIRTSLAPLSLVGALRGDVAFLDSSLAVFRPRTMPQVISDNMRQTSLETFLVVLFAALAVFLAAIGIYGVMAYLVAQRTREIGIRMAFGAGRSDVLRLILAHGAKLTAAGIAAGILAAYGLTRLIASELFGVKPTDPVTFACVAAILAFVAIAACWIPARRAMRIEPMLALREE